MKVVVFISHLLTTLYTLHTSTFSTFLLVAFSFTFIAHLKKKLNSIVLEILAFYYFRDNYIGDVSR